MMKDRIKTIPRRGGEVFDVFFSNTKDAHSFANYWATVDGREVTTDTSCEYKVLENYQRATPAFPHTLNYYPPKEVVEAWMALFEEDSESD